MKSIKIFGKRYVIAPVEEMDSIRDDILEMSCNANATNIVFARTLVDDVDRCTNCGYDAGCKYKEGLKNSVDNIRKTLYETYSTGQVLYLEKLWY